MSEIKTFLFECGVRRVQYFIAKNNLPSVSIHEHSPKKWKFDCCGYYDNNQIHICLKACAHPCSELQYRNYNWPGSTVDRTSFGVCLHELGHHIDFHTSKIKGRYSGDFSTNVRRDSQEKALTGYCPNSAEWFAEMFRLFCTNHALLKMVRPRTHTILLSHWKPISNDNWLKELGKDVPEKIIKSQIKKMIPQNFSIVKNV